jgi:hypothetical protein
MRPSQAVIAAIAEPLDHDDALRGGGPALKPIPAPLSQRDEKGEVLASSFLFIFTFRIILQFVLLQVVLRALEPQAVLGAVTTNVCCVIIMAAIDLRELHSSL